MITNLNPFQEQEKNRREIDGQEATVTKTTEEKMRKIIIK